MSRRFPFSGLILVLLSACGRPSGFVVSDEWPEIFPDYTGVTIPEGVAEPRFRMADNRCFRAKSTRRGDTVFVRVRAWSKGARQGTEYKEFPIYISQDSIDPYIAYRLIEPGYESWNYISLSQRDLFSYKESVMVDNSVNGKGCLNCHTFDRGNPDRMLFHARGKGGGTVFVDGDKAHLTNFAKVGPKMQGVYPAWHPDGRYIVFSSNSTHQAFMLDHPQAIEVYDLKSDLILVDTATDSVLVPAALSSPDCLETFPGWSPDGKTLYYCSAGSVGRMPEERADLHYGLMSIGFEDGSFTGSPKELFYSDTLSVSFPRAKGDYLLFTVSGFATFPIWHKEADLWLMDMRTGFAAPADALNSSDTESYHSWSSNGKWVVFSSRRADSRYTRLYIAHFDGQGHFSKPFMLPQKDPDFDTYRLYSYNLPEFVGGKVKDRRKQLSKLFGL